MVLAVAIGDVLEKAGASNLDRIQDEALRSDARSRLQWMSCVKVGERFYLDPVHPTLTIINTTTPQTLNPLLCTLTVNTQTLNPPPESSTLSL